MPFIAIFVLGLGVALFTLIDFSAEAESEYEMKDRLYKESIARGSLVRVLDLPVPPEPSSMVDGVDLKNLSVNELGKMRRAKLGLKEQSENSSLDLVQGHLQQTHLLDESSLKALISIDHHIVKSTGRGRMQLAKSYLSANDYDACRFWMQEATVIEGISPFVQQEAVRIAGAGKSNIPLSVKNTASAFVAAGIDFWHASYKGTSELTLPKNHDTTKPVPLVICLHPFLRDMSYYTPEFRQKIANQYGVAVLAVGGTKRSGPNQLYWLENYPERFREDKDTIDAQIKVHVEKFTELPGRRVVIGLKGAALLAFGLAFWNTQEYIGAISIEPEGESEDGIVFGQIEPDGGLAHQTYRVCSSSSPIPSQFASLLERVATKRQANIAAEKVQGLNLESSFEFPKEPSLLEFLDKSLAEIFNPSKL